MTRRYCLFVCATAAGILLAAPLSPQMRRGSSARRGRQQQAPGAPESVPPADFSGTLRKLDKKEILLEVEPDRVLNLRRTGKTKFLKGSAAVQPSAFKNGDHISVEATREVDGSLTAVAVFLSPPPAEPGKQSKPEPNPGGSETSGDGASASHGPAPAR
ncbi:MAG TPA: hypothetical protein VFA54_05080 [Bryobacterales bacterium]|nr:hypothetical protein [Bryobacterales bacterium]